MYIYVMKIYPVKDKLKLNLYSTFCYISLKFIKAILSF